MEIRAELQATGPIAEGRTEEEVRRETWIALVKAASFLQGEISRATPVYTGQLRGGWQVVYDEANLVARVVNNVEHALPTELGRRAAMPPVEPIKLWVERKLGLKEPESESVAWAIARKKAREFTPGQHFIERTFDSVVPALERLFEQAALNITKRLES